MRMGVKIGIGIIVYTGRLYGWGFQGRTKVKVRLLNWGWQ